jgi:hypothetical protein
MRSAEFKADPEKYRADAPLTGDESRVAEVQNVAFPQPLAPVDDLPPTTVITRVRKQAGKVLVQGTTADNGTVRSVRVNGREAKAVAANFAQWEIELETLSKVEALAEDAAGNVEKRPHVVAVR